MTAAKLDPFLHLEGRRFLVTGATGGIGRATALLAAEYGAHVALAGRDTARLEALRALLAGDGHVVLADDLSDESAVDRIVTGTAQALGGIDATVHAAGVHSSTPVRALGSDEVAKVLELNVTSALLLARAVRHRRIARTNGTLVLVSSVVARVGQPGLAAYAASKGALSAASRSLAMELLRDGIRVNAVEPGIVRTGMTDGLRDRVGATAWEAIEAAHPLGLGDADDVARAILFLSSTASRWIVGSTLVVDGGYTAV